MKHLLKLLACLALLAAPIVAGAQPGKNPQNNKENTLIDEGEQNQQLSRAMHFYNLGEYSQALVCFRRAGSTSGWTAAQLAAYNRCREEAAYATWKAENGELTATGETAALDIVRDFPTSTHADEMKSYLFEYYMSLNNFDAAKEYAETMAQKKRLEAARNAQNKSKKKPQHDNTPKSTTPGLFHPTLGIGAELCIIDIEPLEAALPVELRLFRPNCRLNLHIGARLGVRGTISGDSTNVLRGGVPMQLKGTFCYYQVSPFIKARLNLGSSPSRGGLFLSAIGRVNYNFGYSYFQELSDLDYYGNPTGGDTRTQHVDILTPFTYTGAAELGYGGKRFEVYLYYSYDFTRPISQQTVTAMGRSAADPHHELMAGTNFGDHFNKVGFIGGGLRLYLSD